MGNLFKHKGAVIGVVVVIGFIGWYVSSSGAAPATLSSTPDASTGPGDAIVQTLVSLQTITLSGTIFSDPAFMSLNDLTTAIIPEAAGRTDPFAPLLANVAPTATTTSKADIFKTKK